MKNQPLSVHDLTLMDGWESDGPTPWLRVDPENENRVFFYGGVTLGKHGEWGSLAFVLPPEVPHPAAIRSLRSTHEPNVLLTVAPDGRVLISRTEGRTEREIDLNGFSYLPGRSPLYASTAAPDLTDPRLTRAENIAAWALFWPEWVWGKAFTFIVTSADWLRALHSIWREERNQTDD